MEPQMRVILDHDRATLLHGDSMDLSILPDNSVDAIVTDPPYLLANASGTGFMGREWDSVEVVEESVGKSSEAWHRKWAAEALRVLKPGGHLLSFGGSRTAHRMISAVEDVGFEIRDVLNWCYMSGFPKSLDISKQVDKSDAASERRHRALAFTEWVRSTGLTAARLNEITGTAGMGNHYVTAGEQPQVATREHLEMMRPHVQALTGADVPDWVEELVGRRVVLSEQYAKREVVGMEIMADARVAGPAQPSLGVKAPKREVAITEAYTEEARKWQGWGTALKPSYEPCVLARKPLDGTVAGNILEWGVGGLNIDGCRIGRREGDRTEYGVDGNEGTGRKSNTFGFDPAKRGPYNPAPGGRWPSNIVMSHSDDCVLVGTEAGKHAILVGEKLGAGSRMPGTYGMGKMTTTTTTTTHDVYRCAPDCPVALADEQTKGAASRFFFCSKPSKAEKEAGLDHLPVWSGSDLTDREEDSPGINNPRAGAGKGGARNCHVTVKPVALMRYLCRLVCPPGGTVLDVFAGSGTTGVAALAEGFSFIGVEKGGDADSHLPVLVGRIRHALGLPPEAPPDLGNSVPSTGIEPVT
jgi:DNA modification methylase